MGQDAAGALTRDGLLALALTQMPASVVVVFDAEQRIVLASGSGLAARGLTSEMLAGRRAGDVLPADRREAYLPALAAALEGRDTTLEVPGFGSDQVFSVLISPVRGADDEVVGGLFVATDVTERARLLERAEESEARFRVLAENASDVVYLAGSDSAIRWASPSCLPVLGIAPEALVGMRSVDLIHPDDVADVVRGRELLYDGQHGDRGGSITRYRTASGEYRAMAVTVRRIVDVDGTPAAVIALRDVQEQEEALRALAASEEQFRRTMEAASVGMAIVALDGHYLEVNAALCAMLGYEDAELRSRYFGDVTHPDDVEPGLVLHRQLLAGAIPSFQIRKRYVRKDGSLLWGDLAVAAVRDDRGELTHTVSQIIDVTREIEATDELERTAERYRVLAENASDIVYEVDRDGRLLWVSPSLTAVLGWAPEQWLGRPVTELVDPAIVDDLVPEIVAFFAGQGIEPRVARFPAADGSMREMSVTVHAGSLDERGLPLNAVVGLHDVTEAQRARRELARSEERFRLAMDAAPIGMAISDPQGAFVQVNDALCDLLGLTPDELMGRSVSDFLLPEEQHVADEATQALSVRHDESMRHEHRLASPSRTVWVEHAASLLRGDDGEPLFYVHQFVDRTEARELRADLEYRATHDALTGVINRAELMSQLDHSLRRLRGTASWLGVLFIDLDNLKTINDENGHHAGDVAIQAVAQRLSDSVRAGDLVARLGGDEFVVLLEHLRSRDELEAVAEKLRAAVTGPIEVDGRVLEVGVSVGAVLAAHDEAPDDALARADHGLRRAKEGGRGQVDVD